MTPDEKLEEMIEGLVFRWLDTMAKAPNKRVVKMLVTTQGIMQTFDLPRAIAYRLLQKWKSISSTYKQ